MENKNVHAKQVAVGMCVGIVFWLFALPPINVWRAEQAGLAEFRQAEQNRKIAVQEAEAKQESAKALAQAEIERAKGVAEANRIIGDSLKGNESYLHYLWLHNLAETQNQIIYVPTEASMPVMEAGRITKGEKNGK